MLYGPDQARGTQTSPPTVAEGDTKSEDDDGVGHYVGFAIVVFRDAAEAAAVRAALDGALVAAATVYRAAQLEAVAKAVYNRPCAHQLCR